MVHTRQSTHEMKQLDIPLERDSFLRDLIRELSGLLEEMVGQEETAGFISVVGQRLGDRINQLYRQEMESPKLDRQQVASVLTDLKRRINGNFVIDEQSDNKIILVNTECPFAEKVKNRTSLCMMTSNVFGVITADNLGYAKVDLEKTIAQGDKRCQVVVYLNSGNEETRTAQGREYFETAE